ncbi:hypothetical protein J21TS3_26120 [Paenibacillus cookii]|uniref:Uncharacterized protein n=2 Tax=Paenibacillus TaxID=44249 RepID=A0ABQ4LWX4_9BACL|nr:hypothetical protein J21TS3_26120 [Paenibacillus cookii]
MFLYMVYSNSGQENMMLRPRNGMNNIDEFEASSASKKDFKKSLHKTVGHVII